MSLLRVRQRRLGLVEIGKLEIIVDGIKVVADLHLVALADIQLGHATGFVGADEDHVGLAPALIAWGALLLAAGKPGCEHTCQSKSGNCLRRPHVVLRSPKIKSRWTRSISCASSGACRA